MLQGLRKPVNDLSRGALVDDIVYTIALTAIQAQAQEARGERSSVASRRFGRPGRPAPHQAVLERARQRVKAQPAIDLVDIGVGAPVGGVEDANEQQRDERQDKEPLEGVGDSPSHRIG